MSQLPQENIGSDQNGRIFNYENLDTVKSNNQDIPLFNISQFNFGSPVDSSVKPDDTTFNTINLNATNTYYYPEEMDTQTKGSPRNIMKITIHDVEGGALSKEIKNFQKSAQNFNVFDALGSFNITDAALSTLSGLTGTYQTVKNKLAETSSNVKGKNFQNPVLQELTNTGAVKLTKPMAQIYLHTPNDLNMSYGIQYNEEDMTTTYRVLDLLNIINNNGTPSPEAADVLMQLGINVGQNIAETLMPDFLKFSSDKGIDIPNLIKAKARIAPLLNKEYLFERVKRRSFEFKFKFYPKSKKEIENVGKIIAAFKYYAHPELGEGRYLNAPSVFQIKHYVNDSKGRIHENLFINRINNCLLENIKVNYSDVGVNSTLKDQHLFSEYGFKSPVGIELTLLFKEMVILSRNDFTKDSEFFNPQQSNGKYH